jgi:hypothetical protein
MVRASAESADDGEARRKPRAFQLARHLIAHDFGLLQHLFRQRIAASRCRLVEDDRQRRL